ncbi:hypothetical protein ACNI3T_00360 [Christiangramia sp. ASW11-125]|uniref:hypothetical protein n=1 Tax=Christiangramia sp. ASW11-125 TaxID=3400701 RepID=UPI003AB05503
MEEVTEEKIYPIFQELVSSELNLEQIFLDPNNPRFVSMNWTEIADDKIESDAIQEKVILKLTSDFAVDKLSMNMEVNGYLPIDRIIVREFEEGKFVVLEGNRRICAAKKLKEKYDDNNNLVDEEIVQSIQKIPCLIYTGTDSEASWIFQGLRHIMGVHEWSAFNKAKLLVNLMEEENLNLTKVGKRFGLTAYGAGQWARGYYAFRQGKEESDFQREIEERSYPYFQEVFSRSNAPIREWLEWNDSSGKFENDLNFNELLSWFYPRNEDEVDESIGSTEVLGDWKHRKIKRSDDLRTVSFLIRNANKEFEKFRNNLDLEEAYSTALQKKYEEEAKRNANPILQVYETLEECTKSLENVPYKMLKDKEEKAKLKLALEKLNEIVDELLEV